MVQIYWLGQLQPADRSQVGDWAWFLDQLLHHDHPVSPGFIVPAAAFQATLEQIQQPELSLLTHPAQILQIDVENSRTLQMSAQRMRQAMTTATLSQDWREAMTAAVAQLSPQMLQLRASLHLPGIDPAETSQVLELWEPQICEPPALAEQIQQIWAEALSAKSLLYWQHQRLFLDQIHLAVLVQPLDPILASGLLEVRATEMTIQAIRGMRFAWTRGEAVPDRYIFDQTGTLRAKELGHQSLAYGCSGTPPVFDSQAKLATELAPTVEATAVVSPSSLQAYWLSDTLHVQEVLTTDQLQQLIQLARALHQDLGQTFTAEWALQIQALTDIPQFRLHGIHVHANTAEHQDTSPALLPAEQPTPDLAEGMPRIFRGIAAARGHAIARALVIQPGQELPQRVPPGTLLIAAAIGPDWLPLLQQVVGIVAERGGLTSHSAILARELGIPAVVGVAGITHQVRSGEFLLIDGNKGEVYRVLPSVQQAWERTPPPPAISTAQATLLPNLEPLTMSLPVIATQLLVNLNQLSLLEQAKTLPVDGVGLLRSELMVLEFLEHQHPQSWIAQGRQAELIERLAQSVLQVTSAFQPRPVFYRFLDLRSHEFQALAGGPTVSLYPTLGGHGPLSYQLDATLLDLELAALKQVQQAGYQNLQLLLPFVRTVEEFVFCRQRLEQAGLCGKTATQLWIMAEVPSILFLLPDYVKAGVQGISIGTNDLTQLLLGIDRDDPQGSGLNACHPVMKRAIAQLIHQANTLGIPCSICGDAPVLHPELIEDLVNWGITSISVSPHAVETTYRAIARAEQRLLLRAIRGNSRPSVT